MITVIKGHLNQVKGDADDFVEASAICIYILFQLKVFVVLQVVTSLLLLI